MKEFYIWNERVGIQKAARQCGSVQCLKELIQACKNSGGKEYPVYTHGKTLTICI